MATGGTKPRPEYYNHCIASALLLGVTLENYRFAGTPGRAWGILVTLPEGHCFRQYPREHQCRVYDYEGPAAEGALAAMGYAIRRRKLVRTTP